MVFPLSYFSFLFWVNRVFNLLACAIHSIADASTAHYSIICLHTCVSTEDYKVILTVWLRNLVVRLWKIICSDTCWSVVITLFTLRLPYRKFTINLPSVTEYCLNIIPAWLLNIKLNNITCFNFWRSVSWNVWWTVGWNLAWLICCCSNSSVILCFCSACCDGSWTAHYCCCKKKTCNFLEHF